VGPVNGAGALPYRRTRSLFNRTEHAFFAALPAAGRECGYDVFPKVRLIDLLWLPERVPGRQGHFNRVVAKHVDFVLCEPNTAAPVLVVELDWPTHARADRRERDAFVDAVLAAAGVPILHVGVAAAVDAAALARQIERALGGSGQADRPHPSGMRYPVAVSGGSGSRDALTADWQTPWCVGCAAAVRPAERDGWRVCPRCGGTAFRRDGP
jgi:hypothetical protein